MWPGTSWALWWMKWTATPLVRHRVPKGSAVMISRVRSGSRAASIGLQPGDLVRQIGERPVTGLSSFGTQMARCRLMGQVTVLVQRGRYQEYVILGR